MSAPAALTEEEEFLGKIDHEIDAIFARDGGRTLDAVEKIRRHYLRWHYIGKTAAIAAIPLFMSIGIWRGLHNYSNINTYLLILWLTIVVLNFLPSYFYQDAARRMLMPAIVPLFGNLRWLPDTIDDDRFWNNVQSTHLFGPYASRSGSDYITGTIGNTEITMEEAQVQDGKDILLTGALICIGLQKPAPVRLKLFPNNFKFHFYSPGGDEKPVGVPSDRFNRVFHAFSNDQVLGRTLLTPDVIDQLTQLAGIFYGQQLFMSLNGNYLVLAADNNSQELEPVSLYENAHDLDRVYAVARQLYLLSTFIETVTRDWQLDTETPYRAATDSVT